MDTDPTFDWLTLDEDEEVIWSSTPHRNSLLPALAVGLPLSLVLVGVFIVASAYLQHKNTHYVITTDGLYTKTGVLSRDVQKVEYDKVQNTSYRQSAVGSHFGYGSVDVSTAGGSGIEMHFANVPEPQRVQSLINERVKAHGGRGREGSTADAESPEAVLDDILVELRAIRVAVESQGGDRAVSRTDDGMFDAADRP